MSLSLMQPLLIEEATPEAQAWIDRFNALSEPAKARLLLVLLEQEPELQTALEQEIPDPAERTRFVESLQTRRGVA